MMFLDSVLFAWMETKDQSILIKRIVEDQDTQKTINQLFSDASDLLVSDKEAVRFDGKYTPQQDDSDFLFIDHFSLPAKVSSAIKNPQGLDALEPDSDEIPRIKALFIGMHKVTNGIDTYSAAFQKFKSDQYISASKIHLLFSANTFVADKRIGITIGKHIDCLFCDAQLKFSSFYFARQIFDLSSYYREATNTDVLNFVHDAIISLDGGDDFSNTANTWERRKIASIMDSGILHNYSASKIKRIATQTGVKILVKDKRIVIPTDRRERRIGLGFLDEEVYKGAFSQALYQTNSKRKAK